MKRKLSFAGLAALVGHQQPEPHAPVEHTPAEAIGIAVDFSRPPSPLATRRPPLSPNIEDELRAACTGILQNLKPSGQLYEEQVTGITNGHEDSGLDDFAKFMKRASQDFQKRQNGTILDALEPTKFSYKPNADLKDLFAEAPNDPVQAKVSRRHNGNFMPDQQPRPATTRPLSQAMAINAAIPDRPRPAAARRVASHETVDSTPHTDSTEYPYPYSTAPTSAAVTPARTSKRASDHGQPDQESATKADKAASEWMRQELERRRQEKGTIDAQREKPMQELNRTLSRKKSISKSIREYIRPNTATSERSNTRDTSLDARRSSHSRDEDALSRQSSTRGWRSWGRRRQDSIDSGRSTSRDRTQGLRPGTAKADVNLNRELPPLPSLDQWRPEEVKPKHIANLWSRSKSRIDMRAESVDDEGREAAVKRVVSPAGPRAEYPSEQRPQQQQQQSRTVPRKPVARSASRGPYGQEERKGQIGMAKTQHARSRSDSVQPTLAPELSSSARNAPSHHGTFDSYRGITSPPETNHSRSALASHSPSHMHTRNQSTDYPSAAALATTNNYLTPLTANKQDSLRDRRANFSRKLSIDTTAAATRTLAPIHAAAVETYIPTGASGRQVANTTNRPHTTTNTATRTGTGMGATGAATATATATATTPHTARSAYERVLDISAGGSPAIPPPPVPPKDRKWWKGKLHVGMGRKGRKREEEMTWMDQMEKLGIRDGVLDEDGGGRVGNGDGPGAGAPVVRY